MELLYALRSIRNPVLDAVVAVITYLGSEAAFLLIAMAFFWCFDKKRGYYLMTVGFFGTVLNQFMKLWFRVPRPWDLDKNFTIVESAREGATGYSFPSGHTQNAVGTFGACARTEKRPWLRWLCVAVCVLVPFSRMYLGVHTPQDVLAAAVTAAILIFVLYPAVYQAGEKAFPVLLGVMLIVAAGFIAFVELYPFPAEAIVENVEEGTKNAYSLCGALVGVLVVYLVDLRLNFPVKAVWWAQLLKLVLGLVLVMVVRSVLKAPLMALFGGHHMASFLRYFVMVLVAGIVWPLTFPFFGKLATSKER